MFVYFLLRWSSVDGQSFSVWESLFCSVKLFWRRWDRQELEHRQMFTGVVPGWGRDDAAHAGDVEVFHQVRRRQTWRQSGPVYSRTSTLQRTRGSFSCCSPESNQHTCRAGSPVPPAPPTPAAPAAPPPLSIMVGLTDDLPILLEPGLDWASRATQDKGAVHTGSHRTQPTLSD